jgi:hypothetical protein
MLEGFLMRYGSSVALSACKGSVPKSLWLLAGLLVVGISPAVVCADTTLNSGTTTVSPDLSTKLGSVCQRHFAWGKK